MTEVLCHCSWDIPGVEALPPHAHRSMCMVLWRGKRITLHAHDTALNPQAKVLTRWDTVIISVDWQLWGLLCGDIAPLSDDD